MNSRYFIRDEEQNMISNRLLILIIHTIFLSNIFT